MNRKIGISLPTGVKWLTGDFSTWGDLAKMIRSLYEVNPDSYKCMIAGTRITLESPEAILPEDTFALVMTPFALKNGVDITPEQVRVMDYTQLRTALRDIRVEADRNKDAELRKRVGNYTRMTVNELRSTLKNVLKYIRSSPVSDIHFTEMTKDLPEFVYETTPVRTSVEERLFAIERSLGIVADYNREAWEAFIAQEHEATIASLPSSIREKLVR